jgi:hypothetical protein
MDTRAGQAPHAHVASLIPDLRRIVLKDVLNVQAGYRVSKDEWPYYDLPLLPTIAAAIALVASLVGVSSRSLGSPAMSWSSNDVDYTQDVCIERAKGAFAREG